MTRKITIGTVTIGGGSPVAVQSMTNTDTRDVDATVAQILALEAAGCEIVRCAVHDEGCAVALRAIRDKVSVPLVADIHFDYRLAILAAENGADKLRINPGNIGGPDRVRAVADCAKAHGIPIRVGVNSGSLPREIESGSGHGVKALVGSALGQVDMLEGMGFDNLVVAVKSSSVPVMVEANRLLAKSIDYPLHLGVTEAGPAGSGTVKSAVGIGALLLSGIGDTIRVSLTGDPVPEVAAARAILSAAGVRRFGPDIIACPTCGRTCIDVEGIAAQVAAYTAAMDRPLTIAVMGCVVNGPGEASHADVGVAGGRDGAVIFTRDGARRKVALNEILPALREEIDKILY